MTANMYYSKIQLKDDKISNWKTNYTAKKNCQTVVKAFAAHRHTVLVYLIFVLGDNMIYTPGTGEMEEDP